MNRSERGARASAAAKKRTAKPEPQAPKKPAFRVIIAAHRPKYRARAERACKGIGWQVRSLRVTQDPIGMMQKEPVQLFVVTVDPERHKGVGYLRAAQPFRAGGMRIIAAVENAELVEGLAGQADVVLCAPTRAYDVRMAAAAAFEAVRGEPARFDDVIPEPLASEDELPNQDEGA